jgi:hypothetical protein
MSKKDSSGYYSNYGERTKPYLDRAGYYAMKEIDEDTMDRLKTFKKAAEIGIGKAKNVPKPKYIENVEKFFGKDGDKYISKYGKYNASTHPVDAYKKPFNLLEANIRTFSNKNEARNYLKDLDLNPWGDDSKLVDIILERANNNKYRYELLISEFTGKRKFPRGYAPTKTYKKPTKDYQDLTDKQFEETQQYKIKHKIGYDGSKVMLAFILERFYGISDFYKINNIYNKILKEQTLIDKGNDNDINFRRIFKIDIIQKRVDNGSPFFSIIKEDIMEDAKIFAINKIEYYRVLSNTLILVAQGYFLFLPIWLPSNYYNKIANIIKTYNEKYGKLYDKIRTLNWSIEKIRDESETSRLKRLADLRQKFKMGSIGDAVYSADYPVFYYTLGGDVSEVKSKADQLKYRMEHGVLYENQKAHQHGGRDGSDSKKTEDDPKYQKGRRNNQFRTDMDKDYARSLISKEDAAKWLINKGGKYIDGQNYQVQGEDDKGKNIFGKKFLKDLKEERRKEKDKHVDEDYTDENKVIEDKKDIIKDKNKEIDKEISETEDKQDALDKIDDLIKIWNELGLRYEKIK